MGSNMQMDKGLHEKMCRDVSWISLLSGSNQRVPELAEAWVVCIWREEIREEKKKGNITPS